MSDDLCDECRRPVTRSLPWEPGGATCGSLLRMSAPLPGGGFFGPDGTASADTDCFRATVARAERAEAEVARLRDSQRWRSVADEPPPNKESVLLRWGVGASDPQVGWRHDERWLCWAIQGDCLTPQHWAPLPEPTKEPPT